MLRKRVFHTYVSMNTIMRHASKSKKNARSCCDGRRSTRLCTRVLCNVNNNRVSPCSINTSVHNITIRENNVVAAVKKCRKKKKSLNVRLDSREKRETETEVGRKEHDRENGER